MKTELTGWLLLQLLDLTELESFHENSSVEGESMKFMTTFSLLIGPSGSLRPCALRQSFREENGDPNIRLKVR
jgi:hypothetical protein